VGRDAEAATDVTLRAQVLTYSRSRGLFAGISLEGSSLRPDNDANDRVYGKRLEAKEIVPPRCRTSSGVSEKNDRHSHAAQSQEPFALIAFQ